MRNVIEKNWDELSALWPGLFDANIYTTPYQSYEYLTLTGKGKSQRQDLFRLLGVKELNLVLYKDNEAIAIAPLLIKRKKNKQIVYLRGHFTTTYNLDFVYKPDWSYDDFAFLMDSIRDLLGNVSFYFDRVMEWSATYKYLKKYFASGKIEKHECISIPVPHSYDDWLQSLHKSIRRNITKYYNRLERDNINWSVDYYCGEEIDKDTCKKMMIVYAHRFLVKNNFHFGPLKKLVIKILVMMLLRDKITHFLNKSEHSFHSILYMNNEIAAFTSGIICKDKRIAFSRMAINTECAKYGPGGVLLSSMVEHVVEQNQKGNLDIKELDLDQNGYGGMAYKYSYGGIEYYNYNFID